MALEGPRERPREKDRINRERISKAGLVARLRELQKEGAISWILAGTRFFGRDDIGAYGDGFIDEVRGTDFDSARVSARAPGRGEDDYTVYEIAGRHAAGGGIPRPAAQDMELAESKFAPKREAITREGLVSLLRELLKGDGISWLIAGRHCFEWGEINHGKERFIGRMQELSFGTVTIGVHVPGKGPKHYFYRVAADAGGMHAAPPARAVPQ